MVLVISKEHVEETTAILRAEGEIVYEVGELIERREEGCEIKNMHVWAQ